MDPTDNPNQAQAGEESNPAPASPAPEKDTPLSLSEQLAEAQSALQKHWEPQSVVTEDDEQTQEGALEEEDAQPEQQPEPEVEQSPEDDPKAPEQMRPRLHDPEDIAVAALAKARGIRLSEAAALLAGTVPKPIPGLAEQPEQSSATAELQGQIDALQAEIDKAEEGEDYLTPDHQKKIRELGKLETKLALAQLRESISGESKAKDAATVKQQAVLTSIAAQQKEYPTLTTKDSPMFTASNAVIAEWQADPAKAGRLQQADAPALVVAEAAYRTASSLFAAKKFATLDLALASLKTAPAAPVAKTPPPVSAPVRKVTPPSGSKSQVQGGQASTLQEAFVSANTAEEMNRLYAQTLATQSGAPTGGRRRGS